MVGGNGLIGKTLVNQLIESNDCSEVYSLVRKRFPPPHDKMRQMVIKDYTDTDPLRHVLEGFDVMFVAVGTTMAKVNNDLQEYRQVDVNIPVLAAQAALAEGTQTLIVISSVGANPNSSNAYLKIKGEMEQAVAAIGIPRIVFMRPSVFLNERSEKRKGELLLQSVMAFLKPIMLGVFSKYRPIRAHELAEAMIAAAKGKEAGRFVWHWKEMREAIQHK